MHTSCECRSNNIISESKIDAKHTIFGQEILVTDTPVLICENCKQIDYKDPKKLFTLLKDAYRHGRKSITYSED